MCTVVVDVCGKHGHRTGTRREDAAENVVRHFDRVAPKRLRGFAPPFLTSTWDPSLIQVWTGLFVESAPEWSILVRPPANIQGNAGYQLYEGIVESDRWFGPLFTNLRLIKTDAGDKVTSASLVEAAAEEETEPTT